MTARAAGGLAGVIELPVGAVSNPSPVASRPTVDEWGRDERLVGALTPVARLRWQVSVGGDQNVGTGAALVVVNTRRFALTPIATALALGQTLGRPVRFVGRPDVAPFGPLLRRVGGLLALSGEIAGALRAGEVVVLGAAPTANPRQAGAVDAALIAGAIREHAPVHVAAALSAATSRRARVEVGPALQTRRPRRGPLAEVELAELAQRRLQDLLDELGDDRIALPLLGWLAQG